MKKVLRSKPRGKKEKKKLFPLLFSIMDKRFESLKIGSLSVKGRTKRKGISKEKKKKFDEKRGGG